MYAIPNCHLKTVCSEEYNISDVHDSPIFLNVHKFRGTNNEMNLDTSNIENEIRCFCCTRTIDYNRDKIKDFTQSY